MTDQDYKAFALKMGELSLAFRVDPSVPLFRLYHRRLMPFSLEAVVYAVDKAIDTLDRFPVVSRLRDFALSYREPWQPAVLEDAQQLPEFSDADLQRFEGKTVDELFAMVTEKFGDSSRGEKVAKMS